MEVERLAVGIAAGGAADLDEFLDLGMAHRQIDRSRAAAEASLRDGEGETVHHPDEGDDARGLAVLADLLADRAEIAPIAPDAAAARGEPDILVPEIDDALETVGGLVEEAGDGKAPVGPAIGEDGGGGHEPEPAHIVVEALGVGGVIAVVARHAREKILKGLARQEVTVGQRRLAEVGEQGIPAAIDANLVTARQLDIEIEHGSPPLHLPSGPDHAGRKRG